MAKIIRFIANQQVGYQPILFRDDLEVGAGLHFIEHCAHYHCVRTNESIPDIAELITDRPEDFRASNAQLRLIYESFLKFIQEQLGELSKFSFAEVGCNSGYFLQGLALRGAKQCIGMDFARNEEVFSTFNSILGTRCEFRHAEWDSFRHDFNYGRMPQVDVGMSIAVSCHLADPLHHLAHLCDHSRRAVFVYCPVNPDANLSISFGEPNRYLRNMGWPVSFDNDVRPSDRLLRMSLEQVGFEDIREMTCPTWLPEPWQYWFRAQKAYLAFRTSDIRSALTPGAGNRRRPAPTLVFLPSPIRQALVKTGIGRLARGVKRVLVGKARAVKRVLKGTATSGRS
jgi:hypothetical protein